jgi:hypothetical protein
MATQVGKVTLSTKQQKAIAALLVSKDVQSAAIQAGVSERTLHRWINEDDPFRSALRAAEAQAIDDAVRRLVGAANSALNVLMVLMLDQKTPAAVRLRAAISVLEQLVKLRELNNLEQRIARLEEFYGD